MPILGTAVTVDTNPTTVFDANAQARERIITNTSGGVLYVLYGAGCTTSLFSFILQPGQVYSDRGSDIYNGQMTATRASGSAAINRTER